MPPVPAQQHPAGISSFCCWFQHPRVCRHRAFSRADPPEATSGSQSDFLASVFNQMSLLQTRLRDTHCVVVVLWQGHCVTVFRCPDGSSFLEWSAEAHCVAFSLSPELLYYTVHHVVAFVLFCISQIAPITVVQEATWVQRSQVGARIWAEALSCCLLRGWRGGCGIEGTLIKDTMYFWVLQFYIYLFLQGLFNA